MKPETLKNIKKNARKFFPVVEELKDYYNKNNDFPECTIVKMLVHNFAFDGSRCSNYDHDKDVNEIYRILKLLRIMKDYSDHDLIGYAYKELNMIVSGNEMLSEEIDKGI